VRIAVAVNADGKAVACGTDKTSMKEKDPETMLGDWAMLEGYDAGEKLRCVWVEVDVPLPEFEPAPTIEGTVQP
jgi:hypothetical protein